MQNLSSLDTGVIAYYNPCNMKKIWSVLFSILLGAIIVGAGTGYFLYLANQDRQILAAEANKAKLGAARDNYFFERKAG